MLIKSKDILERMLWLWIFVNLLCGKKSNQMGQIILLMEIEMMLNFKNLHVMNIKRDKYNDLLLIIETKLILFKIITHNKYLL